MNATYITPKVKAKIESLRPCFPTNQALLIPLLHAIQEEQHYLPMEALKASAEYLELPLSAVREVVTFYTMFNQRPLGKINLQVCVNISCWLNGSEKLVHCLEKRLGVGLGGTSKDGNYTLSEVECLASCGTAPVMQANDTYYENLNEEKLNKLLDQWDQDIKAGKTEIGKLTPGVVHG